jgi:hypothetical protein
LHGYSIAVHAEVGLESTVWWSGTVHDDIEDNDKAVNKKTIFG